MDLASAKAVITGGASGLGFATAERVIAAGGHVVLMDVNEEQGVARAAELGDRALFVRTDVSSEENVKASVQSAKDFMGGITLAVNCAGIATAGRTLGREGTWPAETFNRGKPRNRRKCRRSTDLFHPVGVVVDKESNFHRITLMDG